MNCSDYVAHCSDHLDGLLPEADRRAFEEHRSQCLPCRRYAMVLEQGATLLHALPEPELAEDFVPRLQHRIYSVDEEQTVARGTSATPAMAIVGMALLLTAVAWAPALWNTVPVVVMEPIVVDEEPSASRPIRAMPANLPPPEPLSEMGGLFDDGQALMYEYSPLSQRYRQRAAVRRAGLQRDR